MPQAFFRFYAELNDFLPGHRQQVRFAHRFELGGPVKDMIESLGPPHTEVDLILANGESVDFAHRVRDGDEISVYPVFESFDIASLVRVRPSPLRETRFVLDTHLGKLARYLRMLGFDALYRNDYQDEELACVSSGQQRILLTRDRGLLKRSMVTHGYCVRSSNPREQLDEVFRRFDLYRSAAPFTRCLRCNGMLAPVQKKEIDDRLQPRTRRYHDTFHICRACDTVYWKGSHHRDMIRFVEEVLGRGPGLCA